MLLKHSLLFTILITFFGNAFAQLGALPDVGAVGDVADVANVGEVADLPVDDLPTDDLPVDGVGDAVEGAPLDAVGDAVEDAPLDDVPVVGDAVEDAPVVGDDDDAGGDETGGGGEDDTAGGDDSPAPAAGGGGSPLGGVPLGGTPLGGGNPLTDIETSGIQDTLKARDKVTKEEDGEEGEDGTVKETLNPLLPNADPTSGKLDNVATTLDELPLKESTGGSTQILAETELGKAVKDTVEKAELHKITDAVQEIKGVDQLIGHEDGTGIIGDHILKPPGERKTPVKKVCTPKCGRNETFTCGPLCGDSCALLHHPPRDKSICNVERKCVHGCYCKSGYNRDPITKECIHGTECPLPFYEHVYFHCDEPLQEPQVCGNPCKETFAALAGRIQCDPNHCVTTCYCKKGYFRNDEGKCISNKEINTFDMYGNGYMIHPDSGWGKTEETYTKYGPRNRIIDALKDVLAVNEVKDEYVRGCSLSKK